MNPFIALLLLSLVALIGLYVFISIKPATLARAARAFTTTFAALAGTGLLLTGRFGLALIVFIAAVMAIRALRGGVATPEVGLSARQLAVLVAALRVRPPILPLTCSPCSWIIAPVI